MAILISSGTDWTDRTKRLTARAPGLDIEAALSVIEFCNGVTKEFVTLLRSVPGEVFHGTQIIHRVVATFLLKQAGLTLTQARTRAVTLMP